MLDRRLEKEQLKQKASPRPQKRVLQVAEDEAVIDYACAVLAMQASGLKR